MTPLQPAQGKSRQEGATAADCPGGGRKIIMLREAPIPATGADALVCERAWLEIDLDALTHNIDQIQGLLLPSTELMAVVKADAYGHGATTVATTALQRGATGLGVATIREGSELRQAGIRAPILILGATHTLDQLAAICHWELQPTLCSPEQALLFAQHLDTPLPVHLKIDTGMSRLGPLWSQGAEFIELVYRLPNLQVTSIYSHLATADTADTTFMHQQQDRFEDVFHQVQAAGLPLPKLHLANSAGTLCGTPLHYDLVRVGLALYGLYPSFHLRSTVQLKPVMQVKARVVQVKTLPPGTGVSYNHSFVTDRTLPVAVVGIGYADGVPRALSNRMQVLLRGQGVRQIGAITMDQMMIDVSRIDNPQVGEVVTLIGQDGKALIPVERWAEALGTISYEVVCQFKHRLPRVAVQKGPASGV